MELALHRLRMLRELARRGTITEAAAALHYTPSGVSQQLAALERDVDTSLFERVGRRVRLTEAGRVLADHAEEVLLAEQRARVALERARERVSGNLTVGVLATVAASLVPPALATLRERHPAVGVSTREVDPEATFVAVRRGDLDLAFELDYPAAEISCDPDLDCTLIGVERLHLVAAHGQLAATGSVDLADLAECDWVASGSHTDFGRALRAVCHDAGFEPRITHQVDEQATAMAMVAAGLGVTLVADLGLTLRPAGVEVFPLREPMLRRVMIVSRAAPLARPAEQAFIEATLDAAVPLGLAPRLSPVPATAAVGRVTARVPRARAVTS